MGKYVSIINRNDIVSQGDDRDNTGTRAKVEFGTSKAGEQYRYFVVFDKQQMEGAVTLTELVQMLKVM